MEVTEEIKRIIKAHYLAEVNDFIDADNYDTYLNETNLSEKEIKSLCSEFSGHSLSILEEDIVFKLKILINNN